LTVSLLIPMLSTTPIFSVQPSLANFWRRYPYSRIAEANTMNWLPSFAPNGTADWRNGSVELQILKPITPIL
jgi:hypothetical protein